MSRSAETLRKILNKTQCAFFSRGILILLFSGIGWSPAHAQYLGYAVDSSAGTVTIFGVDSSHGGILNQDGVVAQTVTVGQGPIRVAVTPDPTPDKVYVTNQGDNSLWVIDVTNLAQGQVSAQNVNTNNVLQLNQPDGIAIAIPDSGTNKGKAIAYVANLGNGTLSVIDTTTDSLVGGSPLPLVLACCQAPFAQMDVAADFPPDAHELWVTQENSAGQGGLWDIDVTTDTVSSEGQFPQEQGVTIATVTDGNGSTHTITFSGFAGGPTFSGCSGGACVQVNDNVGGVFTSYNFGLATSGSTVALASYVNGTLVTVYAADNNANLYEITIDCSGLSCASPSVSSPLKLKNSANSLALTGDGNLLYISEGSAANGLELVDAASFCVAGASGCSINKSSLPFAKMPISGLAITDIDVKSAPIIFFQGGPPPPVVPANQSIEILGVAIANPANSVGMSLGFSSAGQTIQCDQGNGGQNECTTPENSGGQTFIGGSSSGSLPPGGVITITLGGNGGNGANSSTSQNVNTGASCVLAATGTLEVGQQVTATLTCIAPSAEGLSGTVNWGDLSTPSTSTGTTANNAVVLTFTHSYSAPKTYSVSATLNDVTESNAGSVTPLSVNVVVTPAPPSCSLGVSPTSVQTGQTVTGTLTCSGTAGDSLTGTVTWGDTSAASSGTATVSSGGTATISVTHKYTTTSTSTYSVSAAIKDTTSGLAGTVSGSPVSVTVTTTPPPPSCSLRVNPTSVLTTQTVTGTLTCTGTAGDSLAVTVNWGDSSTASSGTATVSSGGTATISLTHQYSTASTPTYSVAASVKDSTTGLSGTVSGSPVAVTVTVVTSPIPPSCTLSASPTSATTGQNVTATLSCTAPAGDSVSGTLNWGDGSTAASTSGTANSSGAAQLQFTYAYSSAGSYSLSGTVTDTTSGLAGTVTPTSFAVTINPAGPTITPGQTSVSVVEGQPAQYSLSFAGGASEGNVMFAMTCQQPLPAGVGCTFSPSSSLSLDGNGNGTIQVTLTTSGSGASASVGRTMGSEMARIYASFMVIPGFAFMGLGMSRKKKRGSRIGLIATFTLLVLLMMVWTGCGGGNSMTTTQTCSSCAAPGNYTVTVTATSQSPALSSSTKLQLVVTP